LQRLIYDFNTRAIEIARKADGYPLVHEAFTHDPLKPLHVFQHIVTPDVLRAVVGKRKGFPSNFDIDFAGKILQFTAISLSAWNVRSANGINLVEISID
jgi:hypothetical protein